MSKKKDQEFFKKDIHQALNIALIGKENSGVSTLINTLKNVITQDAFSPQTNFKHSPDFFVQYSLPKYEKVNFWHLPLLDKQVDKNIDFTKYDSFVLCNSECFDENDFEFANVAKKLNKKVFFVRTKFDAVVKNEEKKNGGIKFNNIKIMQVIKTLLVKVPVKHRNFPFYFISNFQSKLDWLDMPQLLLDIHNIMNKQIENSIYQKIFDLEYENGQTPFHYAACRGDNDLIDHFLKINYNLLDKPDNNGQTPLFLAALNYHLKTIQFLLNHDVNINHQDVNGNSIFHLLIKDNQNENYHETLDLLLKWNMNYDKVDIDLKNKYGQTPLHIASFEANYNEIYYLNSFKPLLDVHDNKNYAPLEVAILSNCPCLENKLRTIRALMDCGANYSKAIEFSYLNKQSRVVINMIEEFIFQNGEFKQNNSYWTNTNLKKKKNLVFEGAGIKIFSFIGSFKALIDKGFDMKQIKRLGGTSSGAIMSLLIALGYNVKELDDIIRNIEPLNFLDGKYQADFLQIKTVLESGEYSQLKNFQNVKGFLKLINSLKDKCSICPGETFREWIESKIFEKLGIKFATFRDLDEKIKQNPNSNFKHVFVVGSNISKNKSEVFSHIDTPDMILSDAIRISISIPFIFEPHYYFIKNNDGDRVKKSLDSYLDGACFNNFPLSVFDNTNFLFENENKKKGLYFINNETIGFHILPSKKISKKENCSSLSKPNLSQDINQLKKMEKLSVINTFMGTLYSLVQNGRNLEKSDFRYDRVVCIKSDLVSVLDFEIGAEMRNKLIKYGYIAVENYIDNLNKKCLISAPLLSSILSIYQGNTEINSAKKLSLKESRIDHNSNKLSQAIYDFYSKGTQEELKYFQSLKINMLSTDEHGNNVLHLAAKNSDIVCINNLIKLQDDNFKLSQLDTLNNDGISVLDIIHSKEKNDLQSSLLRLLINNGIEISTNQKIKRINITDKFYSIESYNSYKRNKFSFASYAIYSIAIVSTFTLLVISYF